MFVSSGSLISDILIYGFFKYVFKTLFISENPFENVVLVMNKHNPEMTIYIIQLLLIFQMIQNPTKIKLFEHLHFDQLN